MLRRGAVLGLALLGLVQGGPGGPVVDKCVRQCQQVYSLNQANFEQVRPSLDACQAGCQFFGRIDAREPSCQLVSLAADSTLTAMSPLNATCSNSPDRGPLPLLPYSPGVPLPHPPPSPGLVAQRL